MEETKTIKKQGFSKAPTKKEIFESLPIPQALASLAVPTIISQLINLVYNIVDTFYIGRTGNSYMVAAVTVSFTLFVMTISFSNLYGVGGGSQMARLLGQGEGDRAKSVCSYSFYSSIIIAFLYSLIVLVFLKPILLLFGASEATYTFAKQYVLVAVVAGNIPTILSATVAHLLRNNGYSKEASLGLSAGGILNIALDPLFMFVLLPSGYEVLGAALATMLSNTAACIYLVVILGKRSRGSSLSMSIGLFSKIDSRDRKALYAVGIPSAILTGLFDIANIFLNKLMSLHGDLQLAAIGMVMKIERLPNAINIGICQGMLPIVAYNYSSGNRERMQGTIRTARLFGLCVCAVSVAFFQVLAKPIIGIFLKTGAENAETAAMTLSFATVFLRIRCLASPAQFLNYSSSFCMQAMGKGKETMIHALFRELAFYIPFMYLLDALMGQNGLATALIAGEVFGAVFAIFLLRRSQKKEMK